LISVVRPGPLTTIQDLGRVGYAHLGIPRAGAMDPVSLRLANRLVANPDGAAALEVTVSGPELAFGMDTTIALVGGHVEAAVDGAGVPTAETLEIRAGQTLRMGQVRSGVRAYLAVAGGLAVATVLGSASCDTLSGIGQPRLRAGDQLDVGGPDVNGPDVNGPDVNGMARASSPLRRLRVDLSYSPDNEVRVVLGPRADRATSAGLRTLFSEEFTVTPSSDRTGARLSGPTIELVQGARLLGSQAMVAGAIQVPPDGQPIVLLANHATHGGYPVVAVVAGADLALVGQSRPAAKIKFREITRVEALEALLAQERHMDEAVLPQGASRTLRKPSA